MRQIELKNRAGEIVALALVDSEDYERANKHSWHRHNAGYAHASIDGKKVLLHRFIKPELKMIDHLNRNKLDCRKENLMSTNHSDNGHNRGAQKNNSSGVKGVSYSKRHKLWCAQMKKGKVRKLKWFKTKEEAIEGRKQFEKELG
jgi:hypothetical protein